jgi:hypothetical protein
VHFALPFIKNIIPLKMTNDIYLDQKKPASCSIYGVRYLCYLRVIIHCWSSPLTS